MLSDGDPVPALKRQLAREIKVLLGNYRPGVTAGLLGIDQPRMSDILNGNLKRFSLQKLVRLLARLDRRVTMTIVVEGTGRIRILRRPPTQSDSERLT